MEPKSEPTALNVTQHLDGDRYWLRGRALRFVLVDELMRRPSMTVGEMVEVVHALRYELGGRSSKIISDALRWEQRRGRVVRMARGVYRYGRAPASTARRIRLFAAVCRQWVVAPTRTTTSRLAPTTSKGIALAENDWTEPQPAQRPEPQQHLRPEPPWASLTWLWNR